jgi:periplasmic divalent cation tolerance protein
VTAADAEEAQEIGRVMVEARLAACANVFPAMVPVFRWEGEIGEGSESVVILKTTEGRVDALIEAVEAMHSYDCPCAIVLPIVGGSRAFLDWISQETSEEQPG